MKNDVGRDLPGYIDGYGKVKPFKNDLNYIQPNNRREYQVRNKVTRFNGILEHAVERSELKNGGRISFHHHLRLGDRIVEQALDILQKMGYRDLIICLSSVMGPASNAVLKALKAGVLRRIETTGLKSPLSDSLLKGEIPEPVIFRSHGGRARVIENGETPINLAFIGVSAVDREGNLSGTDGPNRFGSLGYALADAENADYVIAITDYISDCSLSHISIPSDQVDEVVLVDSIGDKKGIAGGSIRISRRPVEKLIAGRALEVLLAANKIKPGFSYQAGSGGISLLVSRLLKEYMRDKAILGSFVSGGATGDLVEMLKEGLFETLWDVQSFDDEAAQSLGENYFHREMSASFYASPDNPGCLAHKLDTMILSATEIDLDFNVNSITGTNGRILGALGGAPDTAAGSDLTIVVMPSFRGRIPTVNTEVQTVCTPGTTIDVLVTERGIAVNPKREDLLRQLSDYGIPLISIGDIQNKVSQLTGIPNLPERGEKIAAVIEYRDGSVLDCIRI